MTKAKAEVKTKAETESIKLILVGNRQTLDLDCSNQPMRDAWLKSLCSLELGLKCKCLFRLCIKV